MPEERDVQPLEVKLHDLIIQLMHAFRAVNKLQTVEVRGTAAVDVVSRTVTIKDTAKGKNHVIRVEILHRGKPCHALK